MQGTLLASGLGFPEGPTVLPDGRIVLCDGNTGELLVWADDAISHFANTGGSPWGTYLGTDGKLYVNQGGDVPGSGDFSAVPGIQRVSLDGSVEFLFADVAGYTLAGPNQSAFGPDGWLWITDSGTELDDRAPVKSPGRIFAVSDASGSGEMVLERPGSYPNGIAFDAQGTFYWSESKAHRVCRLENGEAVTFCQLPDTHVPDGMAFAADGRLFVANTTFDGVSVLSPDGQVLTEIDLGEHCTNVVFDGSTMYVTATRTPDIEASERTGSFWRVETDATGLALLPGQL
ncbi:MAG TPA: SMP-30/gluconolactonase/LRE family protein [Streptosporangiaceae bacterium]|nr:SMP-30/gluconolactonase/LRE family protein [Streptosporangiaceae bacterium]